MYVYMCMQLYVYIHLLLAAFPTFGVVGRGRRGHAGPESGADGRRTRATVTLL